MPYQTRINKTIPPYTITSPINKDCWLGGGEPVGEMPKNHEPGILSVNGELFCEAPYTIKEIAINPSIAGAKKGEPREKNPLPIIEPVVTDPVADRVYGVWTSSSNRVTSDFCNVFVTIVTIL
jgi:hypothetical protein